MENSTHDWESLPSDPSEQSSTSYGSTHQANSDEESYTTIAKSPPKRRAGRTKFRETRHPVYKGVRQRNGGKWVCEVREPKKKSRIWLGTFATAEMAARAHDVAAMALRGRSACLNFADSAWLLPVPESGNAKDIQRAAAEAAEAFRPSESGSSSNMIRAKSSTPSPEVWPCLEDDGLGMHGLLANMAEGLLLSPPHDPSFGSGSHLDDVEENADMSLWSYSF